MYVIVIKSFYKMTATSNEEIIGVYEFEEQAIDKAKEIMAKFMATNLVGPVRQAEPYWDFESETKIMTLGLIGDRQLVEFSGLIDSYTIEPGKMKIANYPCGECYERK